MGLRRLRRARPPLRPGPEPGHPPPRGLPWLARSHRAGTRPEDGVDGQTGAPGFGRGVGDHARVGRLHAALHHRPAAAEIAGRIGHGCVVGGGERIGVDAIKESQRIPAKPGLQGGHRQRAPRRAHRDDAADLRLASGGAHGGRRRVAIRDHHDRGGPGSQHGRQSSGLARHAIVVATTGRGRRHRRHLDVPRPCDRCAQRCRCRHGRVDGLAGGGSGQPVRGSADVDDGVQGFGHPLEDPQPEAPAGHQLGVREPVQDQAGYLAGRRRRRRHDPVGSGPARDHRGQPVGQVRATREQVVEVGDGAIEGSQGCRHILRRRGRQAVKQIVHATRVVAPAQAQGGAARHGPGGEPGGLRVARDRRAIGQVWSAAAQRRRQLPAAEQPRDRAEHRAQMCAVECQLGGPGANRRCGTGHQVGQAQVSACTPPADQIQQRREDRGVQPVEQPGGDGLDDVPVGRERDRAVGCDGRKRYVVGGSREGVWVEVTDLQAIAQDDRVQTLAGGPLSADSHTREHQRGNTQVEGHGVGTRRLDQQIAVGGGGERGLASVQVELEQRQLGVGGDLQIPRYAGRDIGRDRRDKERAIAPYPEGDTVGEVDDPGRAGGAGAGDRGRDAGEQLPDRGQHLAHRGGVAG